MNAGDRGRQYEMKNIEAAFSSGVDLAEYLNRTPAEAQNWSMLDDGDTIPDGDYVDLKFHYGDVSLEMERAYRKGFNSTFKKFDE